MTKTIKELESENIDLKRKVENLEFYSKMHYPYAPYDPTASHEDRISWLESKIGHLQFEDGFHERWLAEADEQTHQISSSIEMPVFRPGRPNTLSTYWRWAMWMDCMADVPMQMELCLQGLVGSAFDNARLQEEINRLSGK